jgi:hypothetical protein
MKKPHYINNNDLLEILEVWGTIQEIFDNNLILKN